ncbi:hypothetical protein CC1G_10981 [Coprinopsis cinerea okayama7|uniref:F-box domain-containing protein n=1 Tax=Coprinopsis cinerea (strain Okayama-7 / 130 / ATCC MYA-4618 / FGSC 9003) TaxID=240176 RepID=A8PC33_COPC7|nr:hypothetical protein CC1G_10981 [Coprinopsis cinerea okayama7\|eukprot:XP_001840318.1 hypothetical protein CC1G_10981 [Coprinopsis cinerea okayama7\
MPLKQPQQRPAAQAPPSLPLELIARILTPIYYRKSTTDLKTCSLLSRNWYLATRPFIFADASITFEPDRPGSNNTTASKTRAHHGDNPNHIRRRIQNLLKMVESSPKITKLVSNLNLTIHPDPTASAALNESAADLLLFVRKLRYITRFTLRRLDEDGGYPWTGGEAGAWWRATLAQPIFRYICSRSTLRHVDIDAGEIPFSLYIRNTNLRSLSLRGRCFLDVPPENSTGTGSAITYPTIHTLKVGVTALDPPTWVGMTMTEPPPNTLTYLFEHHLSIFRSLTTLDITSLTRDFFEVRILLQLVRKTLLHLRCTIVLSAVLNFSSIAEPDRDSLDFSFLSRLRSLSLTYDSSDAGVAYYYPIVSATVATLPWRQLENMELVFDCPCLSPPEDSEDEEGDHEEGRPWDPRPYFNDLDSKIAPYTIQWSNWEPASFQMGILRDIRLRFQHTCDSCARDMAPYDVKELTPRLYRWFRKGGPGISLDCGMTRVDENDEGIVDF